MDENYTGRNIEIIQQTMEILGISDCEEIPAVVESLRKALTPFAEEGREWGREFNHADNSDYPFIRHETDTEESKALFTVGNLRQAAILLKMWTAE